MQDLALELSAKALRTYSDFQDVFGLGKAYDKNQPIFYKIYLQVKRVLTQRK